MRQNKQVTKDAKVQVVLLLGGCEGGHDDVGGSAGAHGEVLVPGHLLAQLSLRPVRHALHDLQRYFVRTCSIKVCVCKYMYTYKCSKSPMNKSHIM